MQNAFINFCHLNVRSLCAAFDLFLDTVIESSFDIIGLSETWLRPNIPDAGLSIPEYNMVRKDRDGRGGGVAFYIKTNYKYSVLPVDEGNSSLEQLWISIKIGGKRFCFGTLYRPPNTSLSLCMDDLENNLVNLIPEYDFLMFGGDFNVDLLDLNNSNSIVLLNLLNRYGLSQLVNVPTRVFNNSSTLLDLLVCSDTSLIGATDVMDMSEISDHKLVSTNISSIRAKVEPFLKTFRDFKNFDINAFLRDLYKVDWNYIYDCNDVDSMVSFFNSQVSKLFDIHSPYRTVKITKYPAPWLTENLRYMMRLRSKAHSKYKKNKTDANWRDYKALRNRVNIAVRAEKKAFLQYTFRHDPKNFWRTIKYLNLTRSHQTSTQTDFQADEFANFFITSLPHNVDADDNFIAQTYCNKQFHATCFNFRPVSKESIEEIMSNLKSGSPGCDGINLKMLAYITPHLSDYITFIINKSLSTGMFPSRWKLAHVVPIPKLSNPSQLNDFRPISILPLLSKILEKIVAKQLTTYVNEYSILPSTQSGFRSDHSTTTALLHVTDDIIKSWDDNKATCLILLDYSKAFDTIDHGTLLKKLKFFGLGDSAINFFNSYLSGRQQRVCYNGNKSMVSQVFRGVPQGSVLGPLLFSIYTADFSTFLLNLNCHQFADDTQVYRSFSPDNYSVEANLINSDLEIISRVSCAHHLVLNVNKTQLMIFGKGKNSIIANPDFKIVINGNVLVPVDTCKNLGLTFDSDLRFSSHISSLIRKTFGKLKLLYMHKDIFDTKTKLRLCDSLILSHINYSDIVFYPALIQRDRDSLQRLQNACLRFSFNVRKFDHITPSLEQSGWLTIGERFELHMSCLVFKMNVNRVPLYLFNKLKKQSDIHDISTRSRGLYSVPKHNFEFYKRSFSYSAVNVYNRLPTDVKTAPNINVFRRKSREFLMNRRRQY